MSQQKFITSHRFRVKRAEEIRKKSREKISIFDREAFVEWFLLEDIERLYTYRRDKAKLEATRTETRQGTFYRKKQCEKMGYLLYMLKQCIEIMQGKLDEGAYADVWRAIHEHQLMVAAGNIKHLDTLISLTETMLKEVDADALKLAKKKLAGDEFMDELEAHDANVRSYYGLPSDAEISQILDVVEVDAPAEDSRINKPKPNID